MGLVHTLEIILNRWCWPVLFRVGAQSKFLIIYAFILGFLMSLSRCTAPADDLDGGRYPPRSKEHTELILAEFELGELWNEYGLVGDVVVTIYSLFLLLSTTFLLLHIS